MGKTVMMPYEPEAQRMLLPSRGIPYGTDGTALIRPMTAREEKVLATASPQTYLDAIDEIISRCLKEPDIPPEELTEGDRSFILYWLRINSYFPQYRVELTCPKCGEDFTTVIDLSELPIKMLPEGIREPFEVKIANQVVGLRFYRGKDEKGLYSMERDLAKKRGDTRDRYIYRYALAIETIGGERADFATAKSFVESLTGKDLARLRGALAKMDHGVVFEQRIECPLCGKSSNFRIPITAEFFLPTEDYDGEGYGEDLSNSQTLEDPLFGSGDDGSKRKGVAHREGN